MACFWRNILKICFYKLLRSDHKRLVILPVPTRCHQALEDLWSQSSRSLLLECQSLTVSFPFKRTANVKELRAEPFRVSVDETLLNRCWAKAAMISPLLDSLIWRESVSLHLLLGNTANTVLWLSSTWNTGQSRQEVQWHAQEGSLCYCFTGYRLWDEVACLKLHKESWTKLGTEASFPYPPWKTLAFQDSGSLLSFPHCWALWCLANHKCLRSHYSNLCVPQEWASLPRGSPQCIPIGRIAPLRLCHQRKCLVSKRLDAQTKQDE